MTEGEPKNSAEPTADDLKEWDDVFSGGERSSDDGGDSKRKAPSGDLAAITAERDKYLDLARRTRADFENYQTRVRRDMEAERKYAATSLVAELLPVLDNLERSLDAA